MSLILAMFMFALTMSISPGPVNMVIISSGANHGFRKTLPFISGATTGFTLLLILVGFGFYAVIDKYPLFFNYLNIAGSAFIIYVGYKIAASAPELSLKKTIPQVSFRVFYSSGSTLKPGSPVHPGWRYFLNQQPKLC